MSSRGFAPGFDGGDRAERRLALGRDAVHGRGNDGLLATLPARHRLAPARRRRLAVMRTIFTSRIGTLSPGCGDTRLADRRRAAHRPVRPAGDNPASRRSASRLYATAATRRVLAARTPTTSDSTCMAERMRVGARRGRGDSDPFGLGPCRQPRPRKTPLRCFGRQPRPLEPLYAPPAHCSQLTATRCCRRAGGTPPSLTTVPMRGAPRDPGSAARAERGNAGGRAAGRVHRASSARRRRPSGDGRALIPGAGPESESRSRSPRGDGARLHPAAVATCHGHHRASAACRTANGASVDRRGARGPRHARVAGLWPTRAGRPDRDRRTRHLDRAASACLAPHARTLSRPPCTRTSGPAWICSSRSTAYAGVRGSGRTPASATWRSGRCAPGHRAQIAVARPAIAHPHPPARAGDEVIRQVAYRWLPRRSRPQRRRPRAQHL